MRIHVAAVPRFELGAAEYTVAGGTDFTRVGEAVAALLETPCGRRPPFLNQANSDILVTGDTALRFAVRRL